MSALLSRPSLMRHWRGSLAWLHRRCGDCDGHHRSPGIRHSAAQVSTTNARGL